MADTQETPQVPETPAQEKPKRVSKGKSAPAKNKRNIKMCGAKTRAGGTCRQPAMENGRCRYHGGLTPKGALSPHYKTGKYSKYLPQRLRDRYLEYYSDEDLLSLRHEIAATDARITDILGDGGSSEAGKRLKKANTTFTKLQRAIDKQDTQGTIDAIEELGGLLTVAGENANMWDEVMTLFDLRRRLVETEQKRLIAMKQFITAEAAYSLVIAMANIVKKYVTDQGTLRNIQSELAGLLNRNPEQGTPGGSG